MGSGYQGLDQASEDFITIDQEYFKLDVTRMEGEGHDAKTQYVGTKHIYTAKSDSLHQRHFPQN